MDDNDLQKAFDEGFDSLLAYVDRSFASFEKRIEAMEARQPPKGDKGDPGKDIDLDGVRAMINSAFEEMRETLKGEPGQSVEPEVVAAMVEDVTKSANERGNEEIRRMVDKGVQAALDGYDFTSKIVLPQPEKGADADPALVASLVAETVERAVAALPAPNDGKSVSVEDVRPLIDEQVAKAVAAIPVPKDGIGAASAIIDRDGNLIITMTDGTARNLGPVVGKDVDMNDVAAVIKSLFESWPKPKDGADGVGFEAMELDVRDDGVYMMWDAGGAVKEKRIPMPVYRGIWREQVYDRGDTVTWGGDVWHCNKQTTAKPGTVEADGNPWTMMVRRGRDGKDLTKDKIKS